MRLFSSPATPFGRKAVVTVLECGLQDRIPVVSVSGTPLAPGSMPVAQNPLGKIPTLELDDGRALYDSRVISRYLDQLSGRGLYPAAEDPALWEVLTLEATADGIMDAAVLMAYERRLRPEALQFPDWVEAQWQKVARGLDAVEAGHMARLEAPLNAAQIAMGAALGYLDFRHDARTWRQDRPRLAAWEAGFARRPAMVATVPQG